MHGATGPSSAGAPAFYSVRPDRLPTHLPKVLPELLPKVLPELLPMVCPRASKTWRKLRSSGEAAAVEGAVHGAKDFVPCAGLEQHLVAVLTNQLQAVVLGEAGAHDDREVGPHLAHPPIEVQTGAVAEHH